MRKWNFSAGPAAIPEAVLQEAQAEIVGMARFRNVSYGNEP